VQAVLALVVTPEGLPLDYEMLPGNTADKTTIPDMIILLKKRHGKLGRVRVTDRGIPTEKALQGLITVHQQRASQAKPLHGSASKMSCSLGKGIIGYISHFHFAHLAQATDQQAHGDEGNRI
jgi:hypothetical protein